MNADNTTKKTAKPLKRDWSRFNAMTEAHKFFHGSKLHCLPLNGSNYCSAFFGMICL